MALYLPACLCLIYWLVSETRLRYLEETHMDTGEHLNLRVKPGSLKLWGVPAVPLLLLLLLCYCPTLSTIKLSELVKLKPFVIKTLPFFFSIQVTGTESYHLHPSTGNIHTTAKVQHTKQHMLWLSCPDYIFIYLQFNSKWLTMQFKNRGSLYHLHWKPQYFSH